jgi:probable rRNA maturation factor
MSDDPSPCSIAAPAAPAPLDIGVEVHAGAWSTALPGSERLARRAAETAWAALPADPAAPWSGPAEVSLVLADDATVQALNRTYRGRDKPTNVLSFANLDAADAAAAAAPDAPVLLGDVVLALETLLREADAQGKVPGDHLCHLIVHGLLHLLGFDHQEDAEAETMEDLERRVLDRLGIADPYAVPADGDDTARSRRAAGGAS